MSAEAILLSITVPIIVAAAGFWARSVHGHLRSMDRSFSKVLEFIGSMREFKGTTQYRLERIEKELSGAK